MSTLTEIADAEADPDSGLTADESLGRSAWGAARTPGGSKARGLAARA